jgi:hypothetical protein
MAPRIQDPTSQVGTLEIGLPQTLCLRVCCDERVPRSHESCRGGKRIAVQGRFAFVTEEVVEQLRERSERQRQDGLESYKCRRKYQCWGLGRVQDYA